MRYAIEDINAFMNLLEKAADLVLEPSFHDPSWADGGEDLLVQGFEEDLGEAVDLGAGEDTEGEGEVDHVEVLGARHGGEGGGASPDVEDVRLLEQGTRKWVLRRRCRRSRRGNGGRGRRADHRRLCTGRS